LIEFSSAPQKALSFLSSKLLLDKEKLPMSSSREMSDLFFGKLQASI